MTHQNSAKAKIESSQSSMKQVNTSEETAPNYPRSTKSKAVTIDQRYEIKKKIDEGTYAKVYLAQDWHKGGK